MSIWGGVLFTDKVKGFTLIELLAVIVILSVIALIVTPTILNLIEKAKYEGAKSSAMEYKAASEKAHMIYMMENKNKTIKESCSALKDKLTCGDKVLNLAIKGSLPSKGTVKFTKDGDVESITGLLINGYVFNYLNKVWTGKAWTKYGNSIYAESVHYMDSDDVNIINYEENGNENYSLWDYLEKNERGECNVSTNANYCGGNTELIDTGSWYWLASASTTGCLFNWSPSDRYWYYTYTNHSFGVRPVVVLKSNVKLGTGSGIIGDEYSLEIE